MAECVKWVVKRDYADENRIKKYDKKHHAEVVSCSANLVRLESFLNSGGTLRQALNFGFFRSEGEDVYRIGQTKIVSAKETRLYIYARITGPEIQVLTIGDKSSQQTDIRKCKEIVRSLKNNTTTTTYQ